MRIYPVKRPLCAAIAAFIVGLWLGSAATLPGMGCAFLLPPLCSSPLLPP